MSFSKSQFQTEYDVVYLLGGEKQCYGLEGKKKKKHMPSFLLDAENKPSGEQENKYCYAPSFIPKRYYFVDLACLFNANFRSIC